MTSLSPARAAPADIATFVRDHWGIESLHWLRDTAYREDNSTPRTGPGPRHRRPAHPRHRRATPARTARHHQSRLATRFMDRPFKILKLMILERPVAS
jgi:hypothetical protein